MEGAEKAFIRQKPWSKKESLAEIAFFNRYWFASHCTVSDVLGCSRGIGSVTVFCPPIEWTRAALLTKSRGQWVVPSCEGIGK
jgi:hypothetical protein